MLVASARCWPSGLILPFSGTRDWDRFTKRPKERRLPTHTPMFQDPL
jgi:hypothetical protein